MAINGIAVAVTSVGGLLLYSAVKGLGVGDTARSLLAGKAVPTQNVNPGTSGAAALQGLLTKPLSNGSSGNALDSSPLMPVDGGNSAPSINTYLKGLNYSRAQRAGILGNMQIESGFNPGAYNAIEGAIGICQWEGGRRTALQAFAKTLGKSESDLSAQLAFFHLEMTTGFAPVNAMIRVSNNPATVASIFDASYERSAGTSRAARIAAANSLFASDVTA